MRNELDNVFDLFEERGFVEQVTDRDALRKQLETLTTCYIGFDPTARSLHVGSLLPIMSLAHMQRAGHRPIAVVGGGTTLVGDPSGKTEMRKLMTLMEVEENAAGLQKQLSRFIDFDNGRALLLNNADWLAKLKYIQSADPLKSHPHYWLGYVNIGNSDRLYQTKDIYFILGITFALILVIIDQILRQRRLRKK